MVTPNYIEYISQPRWQRNIAQQCAILSVVFVYLVAQVALFTIFLCHILPPDYCCSILCFIFLYFCIFTFFICIQPVINSSQLTLIRSTTAPLTFHNPFSYQIKETDDDDGTDDDNDNDDDYDYDDDEDDTIRLMVMTMTMIIIMTMIKMMTMAKMIMMTTLIMIMTMIMVMTI